MTNNTIKGIMLAGYAGSSIILASSFTGQGDLQAIEQRASEYASQTQHVIEVANGYKSDLDNSNAVIAELQKELDRVKEQLSKANEDVNWLIAENNTLRNVLESELETDQAEQTELANAEIEKANQAVANTKTNVESTLDMSVFNNLQ